MMEILDFQTSPTTLDIKATLMEQIYLEIQSLNNNFIVLAGLSTALGLLMANGKECVIPR